MYAGWRRDVNHKFLHANPEPKPKTHGPFPTAPSIRRPPFSEHPVFEGNPFEVGQGGGDG